MKRIFSLIFTLLLILFTNAQNKFLAFAGPQASSSNYSVFSQKQKTERNYGFQAGLGLKVPFENNLYFAPAIFYSRKGYKVSFTEFVYPPDAKAINNNTTIHTVELAALLQIDFGKGPGHAWIKSGPSMDFQLFGKENFDLMSGASVSRNMEFSFAGYGHYSANLLFHLGYETGNGFIFFAQYTHGLVSINNADGGPEIKHRAYGISIGKYLNRKKIVIDTRNRE